MIIECPADLQRIEGDDWDKVQLCANPRCRMPFIPKRVKKDNKYCQPKCAAYVNMNKLRGREI
jgi:hypothetical protein